MEDLLLQSDRMGELPKAIQAALGFIGLLLAAALLLAVRADLPAMATTAHLALAALFAGAAGGFTSVLVFAVKVWQGRRVQVSAG